MAKLPISWKIAQEKYPSTMSPPIAGIKALSEDSSSLGSAGSTGSQKEGSELALQNLEFMASVGANLFAHSRPNDTQVVESHMPPVLSEISIASLKLKDQRSGLCRCLSTKEKRVHRRICRPSPPSPKVPSHVVTPSHKCLTASSRRSFHAIKDAMIVIQREKEKQAGKMRLEHQAREFQRALARWESLNSTSIRQNQEKYYLMERVAENMHWRLRERPAVWSSVKIVVVGGGMAGLTAVNKLISMGFTDVTLLEGHNRLGGRIHSLPMGQSITRLVELGVPAIDFAEVYNTVYAMANEAVLPCMEVEKFRNDPDIILPNGSKIPPDLVSALTNQYEFLRKDVNLIYTNITRETGKGVNLAFDDFIRARRTSIIQDLRVKTQGAEAYVNHVIRAVVNHSKFRLGDSNSDLATQHIQLHKSPIKEKRHSVLSLPLGMSTLIGPLTENFKSHTVQLNATVCEVRWGEPFQAFKNARKVKASILVRCTDGRSFPADHVIMAVPLGHLKENVNHLFKPSLPSAKSHVIKRLGFGTVSKVFLYFDDPFWSAPFHFIWAGTDKKESNTLMTHPMDVITLPFNVSVVEFNMVGWAVEDMPDSTVSTQLRFILQMYHREEIPIPVRIRRSFWYNDPLFRGTHPYLSTACTPEDLAKAADPILLDDIPRILFAGDYTHSNFRCLLHAARASGAREALRLSYLYDKFLGARNINP